MLFLSFHVDAGRDRSREVGVTRASDGDTVDQVVVTWPGFDPDDAETGGLLRSNGLQIQLSPKLGPRTSAEVSRLMASAVAAIVSTDPFDRSVFDSARRLRVVARVGVGTDTIDLSAATKAGVVIITTPDANEETVADHTLALILGAVRRVVEHDASVRRGEWNRAGRLTAWDLHGCTVGLVGFGRIGQEVARRLQRGLSVRPAALTELLEFFQLFADRCHHGKEEDLLFPLLETKGLPRAGGPLGVMLFEHDEGRGLVQQMIAAAELYAQGAVEAGLHWAEAARSYVLLLRRHIDKENNVLFPMAEYMLSEKEQNDLAQKFETVEVEKMGLGTHERLHARMEELAAEFLRVTARTR